MFQNDHQCLECCTLVCSRMITNIHSTSALFKTYILEQGCPTPGLKASSSTPVFQNVPCSSKFRISLRVLECFTLASVFQNGHECLKINFCILECCTPLFQNGHHYLHTSALRQSQHCLKHEFQIVSNQPKGSKIICNASLNLSVLCPPKTHSSVECCLKIF